jgi:guanylate kinase
MISDKLFAAGNVSCNCTPTATKQEKIYRFANVRLFLKLLCNLIICGLFIYCIAVAAYFCRYFSTLMQANKIIIITAPSGAGKTSITKFLLHKYPSLAFSVSAATRSPRSEEKQGKDYYFMSVEEFTKKIQQQAFIEWEMVYEGKYYGTLKSEIERIWNEGKTPLLDIDVKGAIHVQQQFQQTTLSVFIQTPSVEVLRHRLESRGTESAESLQARINKAAYELSFSHAFNAVVVNQYLEKACTETEALVSDFLGDALLPSPTEKNT